MRAEKTAIVKEIRSYLEGSEYAFLANYRGMKVEHIHELRSRLRKQSGSFHVVKNAFLKHAAEATGWGGLTSLIDGPSALISGKGDVTEIAKVLKAYAQENERLVLRGGMMPGQVLSVDDVKALASVPPRPVLLSMVVGTIAAPMTQLVGVMNQKVCSLLYALKAVEEKKAKSA